MKGGPYASNDAHFAPVSAASESLTAPRPYKERQAFKAYAPNPSPPVVPPRFKGTAWKVWLVAADCFFIGLAPVLVHLAKNSQGQYNFHPVAIGFLTECTKLIFASATLLTNGTGRAGKPMYLSMRSFMKDARHNQLLAVPAGLYAINNSLKFAMQLYFKPTTAKMLSNLKILVIAVLMRLVLKRSFNIIQWEALVLLVAGITVNTLNYCGGSSSGDLFVATSLLYTFGSVCVPSLASVYNEMALKKNMDTSIDLQNWFLYFYGAFFNALGLLTIASVHRLSISSTFSGLSPVVLILVANNALQGVLSSFFFKYADTILKKYSSTIATLFTALLSAALFGHALTLNFCIGVSIVGISMHQFFSQSSRANASDRAVPFATAKSLRVSPSMDQFKLRTDSADSIADLTGFSDSESAQLLTRPRKLLPQ